MLADLDEWFTDRWAEGKKITKTMVDAARQKWVDRKRRNLIGEHSESRLTILGSALRAPEAYDELPIFIALSKKKLSKEAKNAADQLYQERISGAQGNVNFSKNQKELASKARCWTYENCNLRPDSWYIDCFIGKRTKVFGIARTIKPVISTKFNYENGEVGVAEIAFKTSMSIPVSGVDLGFPPSNRLTIELNSQRLWSIAKEFGSETVRMLPLANAARLLRKIQSVKEQFEL